ncbi:hypothetical protein WICMUC_004210 [Wickerhamomyces mucosus]|uniref:Major facilitator superfamily (MFS) profile domain-containing protein n=1 Tax=Wickerhamomyces mucosus TaxID=1378264 RepID=A0A9P8PJ15_9ASCO|nr:hypothetical protein WICMUC_004210 [Wickerhamomyces mucosus]
MTVISKPTLIHISDSYKQTSSAISQPNHQFFKEPELNRTIELTPTTSNIYDEDTDLAFPEGGKSAYLAIFGSFMGLVPVFGMINSVGAIQTYVSNHQLADVSSSTVSWIFSIYTFILFSSGIFSGACFDRNGSFLPLVVGSIFFCGGLLATGNCTTVYQFILAFGVVTGFGNGVLMSPLVGVIAHYFSKSRATWTSVATTGGSVGGICFPLLLRKLYPAVGFPWAMKILALICAICLGCSILFAKERLKPEYEKIDSTRKAIETYFLDVFDYKYLLETKFMFCALGVSFAECSLIVCSVYFPSYAIVRGFSESTSFLLITVVNTTGILGRYIPGYLADRYVGRFNIAIINLVGVMIVSLVLWLPFGYNVKALFAYAALYGFFSGSILSLSPVCCGQISKTEEFGKRYATMYMVTSLTILATIPIGGVIVGKGDVKNYNNFIIYTTALAAVGIICYGISRNAVVGLRLCKF